MSPTTRTTAWAVLAALTIALSGIVGAALVSEVFLLRARPATRDLRAWRLFALTTVTTTLVAGLIGGIVGVVRGMDYPPTVFFAFIEGGIIAGVVGVLLGGCVGAVLATDLARQPSGPMTPRHVTPRP